MKTIYKVVITPISRTDLENLLNEFSKEGWLLETINSEYIIFKKEKSDEELLKEYMESLPIPEK